MITTLLDNNANPLDGTLHCLIVRPDFYTLSTSGVPFVTWLDNLLDADTPPATVIPPLPPLPST